MALNHPPNSFKKFVMPSQLFRVPAIFPAIFWKAMSVACGGVQSPNAARNLAILICYYSEVPKEEIATSFRICPRWVNQIISQEKQAYIEEAVKLSNAVKEEYTRRTDTLNCSPGDRADRTEKARIASQLGALKKQISALRLQVNRIVHVSKSDERDLPQEAGEEDSGPDSSNPPEGSLTLLDEMVTLRERAKKGRRYSDRMFRFAYSMMTLSPRAYKFARKSLVLPTRSRVYEKFGGIITQLKRALTNLEDAHVILENFIDANLFLGERIVCCLGIDAFAFRLFLRQVATITKIKSELLPEQLERLTPLLEDKDLLTKIKELEDFEEEEDIEESDHIEETNCQGTDLTNATQLTDERISELFEQYNSCFIYCLLPLNSSIPCFPIHLAPATHGMSKQQNIDTANRITALCSQYNIDVVYCAVDGDPGWNAKFDQFIEVVKSEWKPNVCMINWSCDVYRACYSNGVHLAVADLLHFLKRARGRFIDHTISVFSGDTKAATNYEAVCEALGPCMALSDRSQLGRMRDYYPVDLFTTRNWLTLLKKGLFCDAFYFAPFSLLLIVIRVPFLRMDFRLKLLNSVFILIAEIIADNHRRKQVTGNDDDGSVKVTERACPSATMLTFAETGTLERIMSTIISYSCAFQHSPNQLRTDSLGTHIVEQMIGNGRHGGDTRWERILANFCQSVLRAIFMGIDGHSLTPSCRLPTAGCRLNASGDVSIDAFDDGLFTRVLMHSVTEAGRAVEGFQGELSLVISWIEQLDNTLRERQSEIGKLWLPNPVTNSAIMARLLKSSLTDYTGGSTSPGRDEWPS